MKAVINLYSLLWVKVDVCEIHVRRLCATNELVWIQV